MVRNQHSVNGESPRILGSKYTIPQRDTVAGDATARSCTSNIRVITWTQGQDRIISLQIKNNSIARIDQY